MNKIEKLIQELCPEGVPTVRLGDQASYVRGLTYSKSDELDGGPIRVLRSNNIDFEGNVLNFQSVKMLGSAAKAKDEQLLRRNDILISAASGSRAHVGKVAYIDEDMDYYFGGFMAALRSGPGLHSRYLFHVLTSSRFRDYLDEAVDSTTINNLNAQIMGSFLIPLPPVQVQQEIVSILNKFAELEAELEAELDARTKQYEIYRGRALDLKNTNRPHPFSELLETLGPEGVQYFALHDVFEMKNGYTPSKSNPDFWKNGSIPWFRMDDIRTKGRVLNQSTQMVAESAVKSGSLFEANSMILATSATIGEHALITVPFLANQRFTVLTTREKYKGEILPKFTFYIGFELSRFCLENTNVSGFASVDMDRLRAFNFPVPPLEIQERIVLLLDTFSGIVSSSLAGLPAEIQARRKQYEYYRNKLLTFKELVAV